MGVVDHQDKYYPNMLNQKHQLNLKNKTFQDIMPQEKEGMNFIKKYLLILSAQKNRMVKH